MKRWSRRRFFRREWKPSRESWEETFGVKILPLPPVTIYGYEDDSEHNADHEYIDRITAQGRVYGVWFSVHCLDGDIGVNPLDQMTEITEEDFERARRAGWRL